jgi:hypothetical protein
MFLIPLPKDLSTCVWGLEALPRGTRSFLVDSGDKETARRRIRMLPLGFRSAPNRPQRRWKIPISVSCGGTVQHWNHGAYAG